jgi:hypothetical protein
VFKDVPVIYGFSSVAPLGPLAAATLSSYFRTNGTREIGQGRPGGRLLGQFAPYGMTVTQGMTDQDPHADVRHDVCQFADDRLSDAKKLDFVHQLLQGRMAEARVHLDRIQRYATALDDPARRTPEVAQALAGIAGEADEQWNELALMLGELQARSAVGVDEVDLACTLNQEHDLDGAFNRRVPPGSAADDVPHAAVRACLGSAEAHVRTLEGLLSPSEADVRIAQAYLRHRPISDATELRRLAEGIARMPASEAQVRALEALGRHYVSDRQILDMLTRLFSETSSWSVQAAIAGILIRADLRSIASPQLVHTLQKDRRLSPPGDDMVDALIRRLQSS